MLSYSVQRIYGQALVENVSGFITARLNHNMRLLKPSQPKKNITNISQCAGAHIHPTFADKQLPDRG